MTETGHCGRLVENLMYFARALRAAGDPAIRPRGDCVFV